MKPPKGNILGAKLDVFYQVVCKFSNRAKGDVRLKMPNKFKLEWMYSVPGGQTTHGCACDSWIFLTIPDKVEEGDWGARVKQEWIEQYLGELDWTIVKNRDNKRFICPTCMAG